MQPRQNSKHQLTAMTPMQALIRTTRYMRRVEAHLPALRDDDARREFISHEMKKWEERYARFMETEGASHRRGDSPDQPTAFDFTETIAALGAAQARYAKRMVEVGHPTPAGINP